MMALGKSLVRSGLLLSLTVLASSSGCKSMTGWKMPGWFSNRQPDADKLAGNYDTTTPTSPATKFTPNAIASKAASPSSATGSGSPYGYGSTPNPYSAAPNSLGGNPGSGLAAQANGHLPGLAANGTTPYQTGSYGSSVPASPASASTAVPSSAAGNLASTGPGSGNFTATPWATAGGTATPVASGINPYGGSYSGVPATTAPNVSLASQAVPGQNLPAQSLPGQAIPSLQTQIGNVAALGQSNVMNQSATATAASASIPAFPSLGGTTPSVGAPGVVTPTVGASLPPVPNFAAGSAVASAQAPLTSAGPTNGGSATPGGAFTAPNSASQAPVPTSTFAPGTTGRSTNYNFSPNAPANNTSTSTPRFNLPPNTASGDQLLVR